MCSLPSIFVIGALGPYLGNYGFKAEHLLVYGAALISLPLLFRFPHLWSWRGFPIPMRLWLCLGLSQLAGYLWASGLPRESPPTPRVLAAVEHLAGPVVIVSVVWTLGRALPRGRAAGALRRALNVLVWGLCLNSFVIVWTVMTGDMGPFSAWLPPSGIEPGSVWSAAMQMGRYGGIFNQPFESGLCYSLAVLGWYWLQEDPGAVTGWEYGRLSLLALGGFASVSKVFLFGGVPLLGVFALARRPRRAKFAVALVFLAGVAFFFYRLGSSWAGAPLLMSYFSSDRGRSLLGLYTGNRFGGYPTPVDEQFSQVWLGSPIFGFGFAPLQIQDNGLLWAFAGGGIVGGGVFVLMVYKALGATRKLLKKSRAQLFPSLVLLLMVMAVVGAPAFTIDRGSTIFWTIYPLAVLVGHHRAGLREVGRQA